MIFKVTIKVLILAAEIFLGIYSLALSDSLLVKFLFFAFTAVIIAFAVMKLIHKLLPLDKDDVVDEPADKK